MKHSEMIGEIVACISMMAFLFVLLVFGTAILPEQQGMHSEAVYAETGR